jgi:hypothetical protein
MATKKPWEQDYDTTIEQVQGAAPGLATQGDRPWERSYMMDEEAMADLVPTQRIRSSLQGATLGGSDELEAYARSLFMNEPVEASLADIRGKLKAYRQARPIESLAFEVAGAIPTSIATAGAAGALPLVQRLPMLGRLAVGGAATGGITGALTSEREGVERLGDVPVAAGFGAALGPLAYYGVTAGGALVDSILDFARRKMGGRGAKVVETEIQRLATESGLTTDEIVDRVARGEIVAENKTFRAAVREYYQQGGPAAQTIAKSLQTRPEMFRKQTMQTLQSELSPSSMGNILKDVKLSDDQIKIAEKAMYQSAFGKGGVVTQPLLQSFSTAAKRSPKAAAAIGEYYQAQTGKAPFFNFTHDGDFQFARTPTIEDMEIVRRGLQEQVDVAFGSSKGATGGVFKELEIALRAEIDKAAPAVGAARATAATTRSNREMFKAGTEALTKSADQVDLDVSRMTPAQLKVYRSGVMSALRAKATQGGRNTLIKNIANPEAKEGQILRTIFPADQLDSMLELAGVAAQSRQAADTIMGGSSTFANLMQQQRVGSRVSAEEIFQFGQNPIGTIQTTRKLIDNMLPQGLTPEQRNQVAQILVSQDANLVRNALTDNSQMARVQARVQNIVETGARALSGAAAYTPAARLGNQ